MKKTNKYLNTCIKSSYLMISTLLLVKKKKVKGVVSRFTCGFAKLSKWKGIILATISNWITLKFDQGEYIIQTKTYSFQEWDSIVQVIQVFIIVTNINLPRLWWGPESTLFNIIKERRPATLILPTRTHTHTNRDTTACKQMKLQDHSKLYA